MQRPNSLSMLAFGVLANAATAALLPAQVVTPKTLPVHQAEQFQIFPSSRAGMANVTVALDDSLLDAFVNPARATRIGNTAVFAMPYTHGVSGSRGGGKTLPTGAFWTSGRWAGTALIALQELDRAGPARWGPLSERTAMNQYAAGSVARRLGDATAVGVSAYWAGLGAIDGVDLLYAGSDTIRQDGSVVELRGGLAKHWPNGRALDLIATHSLTDMTHDVHYTTWTWDPIARTPNVTRRRELNEDRTRLWSAHARYQLPVGPAGWRLGWTGTATRLTHPKIPNYEIMNVPRDPGTTYGYNAGAGISHVTGNATFGLDVILEPIFSETWADAARDTVTVSGRVIAKGGKTVENRFRFNNAIMRIGFGNDPARPDSGVALGYQLGVGVHAINYRLEQTNNVLETDRSQREHWMEWSPTIALRFRVRALDVEYGFRRTCGTGGCDAGTQQFWGVERLASVPDAGGIIAAPSRPIDFESGVSSSHRFSIIIPVR